MAGHHRQTQHGCLSYPWFGRVSGFQCGIRGSGSFSSGFYEGFAVSGLGRARHQSVTACGAWVRSSATKAQAPIEVWV